jgi:hypothetical protein
MRKQPIIKRTATNDVPSIITEKGVIKWTIIQQSLTTDDVPSMVAEKRMTKQIIVQISATNDVPSLITEKRMIKQMIIQQSLTTNDALSIITEKRTAKLTIIERSAANDAPSLVTERRMMKWTIMPSILAKEGMDVCSITVGGIPRRGPKRRGSKRIHHTKHFIGQEVEEIQTVKMKSQCWIYGTLTEDHKRWGEEAMYLRIVPCQPVSMVELIEIHQRWQGKSKRPRSILEQEAPSVEDWKNYQYDGAVTAVVVWRVTPEKARMKEQKAMVRSRSMRPLFRVETEAPEKNQIATHLPKTTKDRAKKWWSFSYQLSGGSIWRSRDRSSSTRHAREGKSERAKGHGEE